MRNTEKEHEHQMSGVGLFWDESFLWGLISYLSLVAAGIDFDLITSQDIFRGCLKKYQLLLVPGGWAGQKSVRLGEKGRREIQEFVHTGGTYLGICGGAGLALEVPGSLSLLPVTRKHSADRLVNFSGSVLVNCIDRFHPLFRDIVPPYLFHVWWPSQFEIRDENTVRVIAVYEEVGRDFRVADLLVGDVTAWGDQWEKWEDIYGISLNPETLMGEPAVLEGSFGKGKVILSYLHFDTPEDDKGNKALRSLCDVFGKSDGEPGNRYDDVRDEAASMRTKVDNTLVQIASDIEAQLDRFYDFGYRNFLWNWRSPWLLQWKRGIRGLEYNTVLVLGKELCRRIRELKGMEVPDLGAPDCAFSIGSLREELRRFLDQARFLLGKERLVFEKSKGRLGKLNSENPEIDALRKRIFGSTMAFEGYFKDLLDHLDSLLVPLLKCKVA